MAEGKGGYLLLAFQLCLPAAGWASILLEVMHRNANLALQELSSKGASSCPGGGGGSLSNRGNQNSTYFRAHVRCDVITRNPEKPTRQANPRHFWHPQEKKSRILGITVAPQGRKGVVTC